MLIAYQLPFEEDFDDFLLKILQKLIFFTLGIFSHKLTSCYKLVFLTIGIF